MTPAQQLAGLIDTAYAVANNRDGMGNRLGAGDIGTPCMRAVWLKFRWADAEFIDGRILRLFARGQREEAVFVELLRSVGATVWTHDDNGKQFQASTHGGHFKGLIDGVATKVPFTDGSALLCEFKTHNARSFVKLAKGVRSEFPKHFKQAQTYMHLLKLPRCLYCAICKDDDTLYFEFFDYDPDCARQLMDRAETIIFGEGVPPRISEREDYFECRFCRFSAVCFNHKTARQNCRTCQHSRAERDGTWSCALGRSEIETEPKSGCEAHVFISELVAR